MRYPFVASLLLSVRGLNSRGCSQYAVHVQRVTEYQIKLENKKLTEQCRYTGAAEQVQLVSQPTGSSAIATGSFQALRIMGVVRATEQTRRKRSVRDNG